MTCKFICVKIKSEVKRIMIIVSVFEHKSQTVEMTGIEII